MIHHKHPPVIKIFYHSQKIRKHVFELKPLGDTLSKEHPHETTEQHSEGKKGGRCNNVLHQSSAVPQKSFGKLLSGKIFFFKDNTTF